MAENETSSSPDSIEILPWNWNVTTNDLLCTIALIVLVVNLVLIIIKRKFIWIVIKTLPRDIKFISRLIPFGLHVQYKQWKNATVHQLFDSTTAKHPHKVCFYFEEQQWTFQQVQKFSNRVANYFLQLGYKKGDHIGLFMGNCPEYVAIWLGLARIGVIPALINYNLRQKPLKHSLEVVQCKGVIYAEEVANAISELELEISLFEFSTSSNLPDAIPLAAALNNPHLSADPPQINDKIGFNDRLFYIYTSGTTGLPKAAIVKHGRFMFVGMSAYHVHGLNPNDVFYTGLPFYHSAATMMGISLALLFGVSSGFRKKFSASNFWKDCIRYNVTVSQYIGEVCRYLLSQPSKPEDSQHKVRLMYGNGLRVEIWEEFKNRFNIHEICEIYGSTEGNCNFSNIAGKVGAAGFIPIWANCLSPIVLVKVDQYTGEIIRNSKTGLAIQCKAGEPGELMGIINAKRPLTDFEGYSDNNSKAKKIIQNIRTSGDQAFRSGDILMKDDYGFYYFKDRIGDTFRWKGENVSTTEVETVINKLLMNEQDTSTVYGVNIPNCEGRAGMVAIVDPDHNKIDLDLLAIEVQTQLPAYARPLFVRLLSTIDMTGTFKVKKVDLQKDGFNIHNLRNDFVYFYQNSKYVRLDEELYSNIINGNIKL